eukprot:2847303-Pyramimonas_sp.AAC.1
MCARVCMHVFSVVQGWLENARCFRGRQDDVGALVRPGHSGESSLGSLRQGRSAWPEPPSSAQRLRRRCFFIRWALSGGGDGAARSATPTRGP